MECWWKHYIARLPVVTTEDKQDIVDITGGIPLLLQAFLIPDPGSRKPEDALNGLWGRKAYSEERGRILGSKELAKVGSLVAISAREQKSKLGEAKFIQ